MSKLLKILRTATALATILLLVILALHCVDIYRLGTNTGVLDAVFTYDDVASRLKGLVIPGIAYFSLVIVTSWLGAHNRVNVNPGHHPAYSHKAACSNATLHHARAIRWSILIVGVILVLWGIANGSLYDVLVKSINICTECIGLG